MKYGKTVSTLDRTVYLVQTNWPSTKDRSGNNKFSSYRHTAYTSRKNPGGTTPWNIKAALFIQPEFSDLLKGPERANYETLRDHKYNDSLAFLTAERAFAVAAVLEEHGLLASPYETDADWAIVDRGLPLKVRVVEHRVAKIDRVVISA